MIRGAVVILGATARLAPAVAIALDGRGWRPIRCGRSSGEIACFDAAEPAWHCADRWRSALAAADCAPEDLAGVVNLVVAKRGRRTAIQAGCGAVRAAAALAELQPAVTTVHLGSVAEFRRGHPSPYAAAKRAARADARARKLSVILTIGVVPRPVGDPHDALLRWLATRIPEVATLRIDVSTPEHVGEAIAVAFDTDWLSEAGSYPAEVTLAGTPSVLGSIVGVPSSAGPRWYSDVLVSLLARLPMPPGTQARRAWSIVRQAAGRSPGHYQTGPPGDALAAPAARGWSLTRAGAASLWLVPPPPEREFEVPA